MAMSTASSKDLPAISDEFANADLGDVRRTKRLQQVAARADDNPDAGFPQMVASDSELEGVYRLLSNEDVTPDEVIDPHIEATLARAETTRTCVVIHDTTAFSFGGHEHREGLGMLNGNGQEQGFFAHVSLAVIPDHARTPLGVCAVRRHRRLERTGVWRFGNERQHAPDRESLRWEQQLELVEKRCNGRFSAIHVADREADIFDVLALANRLGARFVIRGHHDRNLSGADEDVRLLDRVRTLVPVGSKSIELGSRHDRGRPLAVRSKHPARKARHATISVASCAVSLARPYHAHAAQEVIDVNVVRVWEHAPVDGEPPVEWILYTSERVDTVEQMFAVVDIYRCRWVIEEFFKALKTGCAFEKRQLESFHALSNALSLFIPIAWKMLLARSLARDDENAPAETLLSPVQLELLKFRFELAVPIATAKEATYVVAKLGGHLRRNGMPGWQTLARGFEALLLMQVGWRAALQAQAGLSGA
jgi:hypothetical protein